MVLTARDDFSLRPENGHALKTAHVDVESLITLDDLTGSGWQSQVSYALVDHHTLLPIFSEQGGKRVVSIVDHHDPGQTSFDSSISPQRIDPTVGSCSSLVATTFFTADSKSDLRLTPSAASLLIMAILIDTGLRPTERGGKFSRADAQALEILLPSSGILYTQLESLGSELAERKANVSDLSSRDLLRRDYKEYRTSAGTKWGLSTVPLELLDFANKGKGLASEIERWMAERDLRIAGVLTSYSSKRTSKHKRELLLCVDNAQELSWLFEALERDSGSLELSGWDKDKALVQSGGDKMRVWRQKNSKATRKQVAPLLEQTLDGKI